MYTVKTFDPICLRSPLRKTITTEPAHKTPSTNATSQRDQTRLSRATKRVHFFVRPADQRRLSSSSTAQRAANTNAAAVVDDDVRRCFATVEYK